MSVSPAQLPIPPVVRRNTWLLAATQAFVGVGTQMVPALGAVIVVQFLGTATLAGLATSILNISRVAISYPVGWLTDTHGRRAGLYLGMALSLVGSVGVGLSVRSGSFPWFVAMLLVFGLGVGAGQQLRLAAADMYVPARRGEGLGKVLTGALLGGLGGPILVSVATSLAPRLDVDPTALAWLLVPVVLVPSAVLVAFIRPDPREIARNLSHYYPGYVKPAPRPIAESGAGPRDWLANPVLRTTFVASLAAQGVMTTMMAMTSLALSGHGYGLPLISASVSLHVAGMYGLSIPIGRLADRYGRRVVMLGGLGVSALGSVLIPSSPEYVVVTTGTFLVGMGWSCVSVSAAALIADMVGPDLRGRAIGVNDAFSTGASVVMPLLGGPLVQAAGLPALAAAALVVLAPGVWLLLRLPANRMRSLAVATGAPGR